MEHKKKMIVLSWDAVGSRDLPFLKTLPGFGSFFRQAAGCGEVKSVYPSLTYPAHTSIITGLYPRHHGVVNNVLFQPKRKRPDWFWQRKYIKSTTLYDEARAMGMKTAALLWPVTGKAKITYNLPEILPNRPWENQITVSLANGTPWYEWELQKRFGGMRKGVSQPYLDHFVQSSMLYTLTAYQPELTLVHFTDVDTSRHMYGVESPEALAALERHDKRLSQLMDALEAMGWKDKTDVVVLGDHCQIDTKYASCPNYELAEKGYLAISGGRLCRWTAIARDCDGSCYIYVRKREDMAEVGKLLEEMRDRKTWGIRRIYTAGEAAALGADPSCAFMLEAEEGWYFQNGWEAPCFEAEKGRYMEDSRFQAATHGYLPDRKEYKTIFFAAGPDFQPGARVKSMSLVDEGPTLARALGFDLRPSDGRVMEALLAGGIE